MNSKGQLSLGVIFTIFIGVIVGLVFVNEIGNQQGIVTTKSTITDEGLDMTIARIANSSHGLGINISKQFTVAESNDDGGDTELWKQTSCALTGITIKNQTNGTLVDDTDYVFTESLGNLTFKNTFAVNSSTSNNTWVTYIHCRDGYNTDGGSRTVAGLWTIFAGLVLVAFSVIGIKQWLSNR